MSQPNLDGFCFNMGHFNACDNPLITIMSKDRKDRKARTARARVSGPGFGPEKLEPDPDRGISTLTKIPVGQNNKE